MATKTRAIDVPTLTAAVIEELERRDRERERQRLAEEKQDAEFDLGLLADRTLEALDKLAVAAVRLNASNLASFATTAAARLKTHYGIHQHHEYAVAGCDPGKRLASRRDASIADLG